MSTANTIDGQWRSFSARVIHADAPDVQRREMRLAFFAGATAALSITTAIAADDVSDSAGVAILQSLHEECEQAAWDFLKGAR